jgi:hypothetical protein
MDLGLVLPVIPAVLSHHVVFSHWKKKAIKHMYHWYKYTSSFSDMAVTLCRSQPATQPADGTPEVLLLLHF